MTTKDVIAMAREAGFSMENSAAIQAAERFATLVRNAALEGAAQKCEDYGEDSGDLKWMANHLRNLKDKT
jgi:hypothetical protein